EPRHGPFAAQFDSRTVVIAGRKSHVLDALLKAAGKKTTKFVHKEASAQLKKLEADVAVQGFALPQMVLTSTHERIDDGKGNVVFKTRNVTLAEKGFSEATLRITVKDDARGSVVWRVKDKDKAKKLAAEFTEGLEQARKEGRRAAERRPKLAAVVRFL